MPAWVQGLRWVSELPLQAWIKDVRSNFVAVTDEFAVACDSAPFKMLRHTEREFFSEERVDRFRADDRRAVAAGHPIIVLEDDGEDIPFQTLKAPVLDNRGRVAGSVGIAAPITESNDSFSRECGLLFGPSLASDSQIPDWLSTVKAEIDRDFMSPIDVAALAAEVGRHPDHVTRSFHRAYGAPPVEYAHRRRAEWIAHELARASTSLGRLAQQTGFADQSHMTRIFSRYFGITPAAYREAMSL